MLFYRKLKSYGKFKVGDIIKLTSCGSFNSSLVFPKYLSRDERTRFVYNGLPYMGNKYQIIKILKTIQNPKLPLFVIEDINCKEIYIVGETSLKRISNTV